MRKRASYSLSCVAGLLLAVPVMGQTSSAPDSSSQPAAGSQVAAPAAQQAKKVQPANGSMQVAMSTEELRERILLDRIEELEKRLTEVEARQPSAAPSGTQAPADTSAQTPASTPPATPAPASPPAWSAGPIDFSGLVDVYYGFNANHPASMNNQLYNFDVKANQFSLNMAKLSLAHSPDPVGFQLDFGFGRAFDIIAASEVGPNGQNVFRFVEQAFASLKPAGGKGFQVDFGKFNTAAGAEVIESHSNWNYSRSLLFAWAIPYNHFGLRTSFPVGSHFTGGFHLVNSWNTVEDTNSGKTIGGMGTVTYSKFTWYNNYYAGPENLGTNSGWRHLYDTTLLLTPSSKVNAYINFDYGQNRQFVDDGEGGITNVLSKWYGVATALHFQPTSKWAFTPRVEWFKDRDGFSTGRAQDLKEVTLTGEYKWAEGLLARLEYRRDWSNQPFFDKNSNPASEKHQDTLTLGVVAFFGPKR